ncbi:DUF4870 domain-containing protein [Micrococcus luteus]
MAKSDRRAPRRAAETPTGQTPASTQDAGTGAEAGAPQTDRAPSGRIRPRRASLRRSSRRDGAGPAGGTVAGSAESVPGHAAGSAEDPRRAQTVGTGSADAVAPQRLRARAEAVDTGTAVKTRTDAPAEPRPARPVRPATQQRAARRPSWMEAPSGPGAPLTAKQDRERATMAHFGVAVGFVAPLAIWLLYRDRGPFTAQEAKEALNFAVPPTLLMGVFFFLGQLPVLGPVFAVLGALVWMVMAFYGILGGSQVNKGRPYRYPFNLRILR